MPRARSSRTCSEKGLLYRVEHYPHRYPVCWRCSTELVFRLVDEWFIIMDDAARTRSMDVTRAGHAGSPSSAWPASSTGSRNMDDWMISKKRYWGLALPIYDCAGLRHFEVIGCETELQGARRRRLGRVRGPLARTGPGSTRSRSPARSCGEPVARIPDVGNPWLDAGIVPFSTLEYRHDRAYWEKWFPADCITESFPGQFRNWFYSLLAMSTALDGPAHAVPERLLGYALVRDENGEEMHKSKGNAIWFDDAAEKMGVDVMRWLFLRSNPGEQPQLRLRRRRRDHAAASSSRCGTPTPSSSPTPTRRLDADRRMATLNVAELHRARPLGCCPS